MMDAAAVCIQLTHSSVLVCFSVLKFLRPFFSKIPFVGSIKGVFQNVLWFVVCIFREKKKYTTNRKGSCSNL